MNEAYLTCRRHDSAPAMEVTAPLPIDLVVKLRSFSAIGVDNAGPLLVKSNGENAKA